ncbi:MAG: hypothetical protein M3N49_11840 [Candidatus Eremiobacteraeota bacterium]|nr:hypothetical protein [Candidatus Eremiobacteraeota bacterium]
MKTTPQPTWADVGKLAGQIIIDTMERGWTLLEHARAVAAPMRHREERRCRCGCGCCEIPETECPTRCIGPIEVGAMTGQTVSAVISVVNRSSSPRNFTFSATPFQCGSSSALFAFTPAALTLAAGASGYTVASLTIPVTFAKGEYQDEIIVTGAYEQCVGVELEVGCEEMRSAKAEVVQLDAPFRIRAHRWYDHFQCVEPCGPQHHGPGQSA